MKTMIFLPPLPGMTGGLAVLVRMGQVLRGAGYDVSFVLREGAKWLAPGDVPVLLWDGGGLPLAQDDIWLVPEGWPHALLPGLRAGARTVVYVQNWAYLLSEWPVDLRPDALPAHYLAVSDPVAWHVRQATGREAPVLRPGIDTGLFCPHGGPQHGDISHDDTRRRFAEPAQRRFAVAWMPRKNKALARQIRELVTAWRARVNAPQPDWVEIHGMTQQEVAAALRSCAIFLATGFPEGCPLPPLEALASGCVGVGFSGFGGWDYMRLAGGEPFAALPADLRDALRPLPGNGLWVSDGDVTSAALALDQALDLCLARSPLWDALTDGGQETARHYSLAAQEMRLLELWKLASEHRLFA